VQAGVNERHRKCCRAYTEREILGGEGEERTAFFLTAVSGLLGGSLQKGTECAGGVLR